jgi:hypothetical protein
MPEKIKNGNENQNTNAIVRESVIRVFQKPYKNTYTNDLNIQDEY